MRMMQRPINFSGVTVKNRIVIQPMEGCDCLGNGAPSELTVKKYLSFARSGAAIIWFEANAVTEEGRTNPRQMMLTEENLALFQNLIGQVKAISNEKFGFEPLLIIQLTHSGRQSIKPICAYHNPVYEATRPITDDNIASDEYLASLPEKFARGALLAKRAGFDGVDVKCCHGYLMQETLSAYNRAGSYGGSLKNRMRLFLDCFKAVKRAVGEDFLVASRFDPSDVVSYPNGFGTDEKGNVDLTEGKIILEALQQEGLKLVNITLGNPYYNPHVNRPFRVGPYTPPEKAEVGLKRFRDVEKELKQSFPELVFVGSGLSYYREDLMERAEELLQEGACDLVGFGRESLAYPTFYADYVSGNFDPKKTCVTCSKCTALMRGGQVSGCAVFNEYYKNLYREKIVCKK